MLEAYVTNLGKYNEGILAVEWLKLPANTKEMQELLKRIGVDGRRYEEIFITDYHTEIKGLHGCLSEHASIDELNYFASLLEKMDEGEREKFEAALAYGEHTGSLQDLINLSQNLDCYDFYHGVYDEEELGYYLIEELDALEIPDHLEQYFNYKAYGRDVSLNEGGLFTNYHYIAQNGNDFIEHYNGRDMPEEYRIFSCPKAERPSILETLKQFQDVKKEAPVLSGEKRRPVTAHDER